MQGRRGPAGTPVLIFFLDMSGFVLYHLTVTLYHATIVKLNREIPDWQQLRTAFHEMTGRRRVLDDAAKSLGEGLVSSIVISGFSVMLYTYRKPSGGSRCPDFSTVHTVR